MRSMSISLSKPWVTAGLAMLAGLGLGAPGTAADPAPSDWPRALGGADRETATGIAVDGQGNSYVTGHFQGSSTFGTSALAGAGQTDVFVAKLDRQGKLLWARSFGGPGVDEGRGIAVDAAGNVLATGSFSGMADFDPGPGRTELASAGGPDAFLLRLSPDGEFAWARRLGGKLADVGLRVAFGAKGEAYVTGFFQGTIDLPASASMPAPARRLDSAGQADAFVAKLDTAGEFAWARRIGGAKDDEGRGVVAGRNGEVWAAGNFEETAGMGPEGGSLDLRSAGHADIFVLRLDAAGGLVSSGRIGGPKEDTLESAAAAGPGGLALVGRFVGTADFDPGPGTLSRAAAGYGDAFLARLEATGRLAWALQVGGNGSDQGFGVAGNRDGTVVATGHLGGQDDFSFVAQYSSEGKELWSLPLEASDGLEVLAVAVDAQGTPHVAGAFKGQTARVEATGAEPVKAAGRSDAFVWRLVPRGPARTLP